jgi:spermidine/putrescine-binding protein
MPNLVKILRDIAAGRKNEVGDHWSNDWVSDAADYIEDVRKGEVYVAHSSGSVMFVGTEDECKEYQATREYRTDSWKINKLEDYGFACYEEGCDTGEYI